MESERVSMKGKYGGPMPVGDFFQAVFQDKEFFARHNITHVRATYLYFTPCDEYGQPVIITDAAGNPIDGFMSAGGYHSAADSYDAGSLEPQAVIRPPVA
jgi:hypothetical protein